jgi:hypothetical protein
MLVDRTRRMNALTRTSGVDPAMLARLSARTDEIAEAALRHSSEIADAARRRGGRVAPEPPGAVGAVRRAGFETIRYSMSLRLVLAAEDRAPTPAEEAPLRSYFSGAADRGVPLQTQLVMTRRTVAFILHRYWELAGPDHTDDMLEFSVRTSAYHHRMERIVVDSYCRVLGEARIASGIRAACAESLLTGTLPPPTGGTRPPVGERYLLLLLPGRGGGPAPLDRLGDDPRWLHTVRDGADVVLLPEGPSVRGSSDELTAAARDGGRAAAVAVRATSSDDVPAAYARARELLDLAPVIGGDPLLITPDDALPERLVASDGEVAARLVALLDRLDAHPGLPETVDAFLDSDLDRSATAERLHVHRRTLTQRLHRIHEITGYDPRTSRGVQVLGLAVTARGLARRAG